MDRNAETVLDEYLVLVAQGGSAVAFRRLAERWTPRLRRHAARLLGDSDAATDAVQDAWLAIARGLRRLEDPSRFAAWAHAITTRRCADEIRRRRRRRAAEAAPDAPAEADADRALDLSAALAALPLDQRVIVGLFYGQGLTVEEVGAALGVPAGTVKSRLHAIRKHLKFWLEGGNHVPA
ncbi:MAG: RNA polymerase sigma factor [Pseudomonadota bacterium]